jgi:hypothetical protein
MVLIWLKRSNSLSNNDLFSIDFPVDIRNTRYNFKFIIVDYTEKRSPVFGFEKEYR